MIFPDRTGAATPPATFPIAVSNVEGVLIEDPSFRDAVLFSPANDGTPPASPVRYTLPAAAVTTHHTVLDLEPGSSWTLSTSQANGNVTITLTHASTGQLHTSTAGVLTFTTEPGPPASHRMRHGRGRVAPASRR